MDKSWRWGVVLAASGLMTACGASNASHSTKPAPSASQPAQAARPQALTPVTIELPTKGVPYIYLYVARDLGLFQRQGLDPKLVVMPPPDAIAGVINGQLTFMAPIGSAARAIERGQPLRVVDVAENGPTFDLVGAPGIHALAQLKNQVVGAAAPQETITQMAVQLLKQGGLAPGQYKILDVGDNPVTAEGALQYHHAASAMFDIEFALQLKAKGYPVLASTIGRFHFPFNGLATSVAEIRQHPNLVRRTLMAVVAATRICAHDESQTTQVMEKEFHFSPHFAQRLYQQLRPIWVPNGQPSRSVLETGFRLDQEALHLAKLPTVRSVYDFSLLPTAALASARP